jgi:superfamily II DNA/RNA helicase
VQEVPLVINYDIPDTCEKYCNRIGHGGRFGREGVVINLATADEVHLMRKIEEGYDTQIVEVPREHIASMSSQSCVGVQVTKPSYRPTRPALIGHGDLASTKLSSDVVLRISTLRQHFSISQNIAVRPA